MQALQRIVYQAGRMIIGAVLVSWILPVALGKDYFTAAVLEHRPRALNTSLEPTEDIISSNLKIFKKAIAVAHEKKADIIVFNEYGLYLHIAERNRLKEFAENVPDPSKRQYNPCLDHGTFILYSLSCLAREYGIYIVANFVDVQPCSDTCDANFIDECNVNCPDDGVRIYNTNVAFDRAGNVVARYHKNHLYFEHLNTPEETEFVTFKTDFGTFGLIICFDIVFKESVILSKEIDTLLFPTWWYDDIVPFNAVEYQQAYALAHRVNFIAANTHNPGSGTLGSGIYSKNVGALVYTYEPDGESKLLVANVPIKANQEIPQSNSVTIITDDDVFEKKDEDGSLFPEHCYDKKMGKFKNKYKDYRCYKSHIAKHSRVKLESPSGKVELCHGDLCCRVEYSAQSMDEDFYLTAFSGTNDVKGYFHFQEETCLLIRCDPFEDRACVLQASTSSTVFKSIEMESNFKSSSIYATVTKNKFRLASMKEWNYTTNSTVAKLSFKSTSNEPLLKAGLFSRNYDDDPPFIPFKTA